MNKEQQIISLDVIDYLDDEGGKSVYIAAGQKGFIGFIISILKSKDSAEQQMKILGLIQKWGLKFENEKETVPNYFEVFQSLKKNGVIFPNNYS